MNRLMILIDYVVQFAGRGLIVGVIFSTFLFAAMMIGFAAAAGHPQSLSVWLIIPVGSLFGTMLGAFIGFIDGLLVGVIASAYLKNCKALSGAVASISTLGLLIGTFYLITAPSELFEPIIIFFWMLAILPALIVAGVTGWDIAAEHDEIVQTANATA